ncbi:MAG: transcriptional regulator NrdR [Deltaproteobacteria bacterium]|nr:transcriptional regulator NrdR [Deltaproteobacteria bacterium]
MKCPYCLKLNNKVIDSRLSKNAQSIRRRRECIECGARFTTREIVEQLPITIIKKDGRREAFSKEKVRIGLKKACEKRKISVNTIEQFIDDLENILRENGEKEIPSDIVGEKIMDWLYKLNEVAYVRFASVYRNFKNADDFVTELNSMRS